MKTTTCQGSRTLAWDPWYWEDSPSLADPKLRGLLCSLLVRRPQRSAPHINRGPSPVQRGLGLTMNPGSPARGAVCMAPASQGCRSTGFCDDSYYVCFLSRVRETALWIGLGGKLGCPGELVKNQDTLAQAPSVPLTSGL